MIRFPSLRIAASFLAFSTLALTAAPAGAQTPPTEAGYASVLRTINPHLTLAKARAYARSVIADAMKTRLDPRFIMSIVTVESRWQANALSRVGARGLGQLMPGTARLLGVNAWNPADNLRGTAKYLKTLVDRFEGKRDRMRLAIASYNAGPKAVERYHGIPPYAETQHYVVKVLRVWRTIQGRVGNAFRPAPQRAVAETPNPFLAAGPIEQPAAAPVAPAMLVPVAPAAGAAGPATAPAAGSVAPPAGSQAPGAPAVSGSAATTSSADAATPIAAVPVPAAAPVAPAPKAPDGAASATEAQGT
ncbi:MAG: lytic transglycosylase domain-containing protein [Candidatus Eremiobacteraeota bacterium]|nr:lytic transglycosylase domain-containing protein [Candidatus Eremiobacteraeota bacterium]